MLNIWEYVGVKNIKVFTADGKCYEGFVVAVFDADETYESNDSLSLETRDGKIYGFSSNEILRIEK